MSVFGRIGDLNVSGKAGRDYFSGFRDKMGELEAKQGKIDEAAATISELSVDQIFDSHHAAYEEMAKDLRDSLPNAMSSDADMAKWEAKLQQANAFAEKAKSYFTSEYAQFDKNSKLATGVNPSQYESRGVRDARSSDDYQDSFLAMNDTDRYAVSVNEDGSYSIDGGGDIFKVFDEHNFLPAFEPVDVRNPESWWAGHSVGGLDNEQEVANNIEGRIIDNPTEAVNAQRWWAESQGIDPDGMDEQDRRIAVRAYAEEAAKKWNTSGEPEEQEEDQGFVFSADQVSEVENGGKKYSFPSGTEVTVNLGAGDVTPLGIEYLPDVGVPQLVTEEGIIPIAPGDLQKLRDQFDAQLGEGVFDQIYEGVDPY